MNVYLRLENDRPSQTSDQSRHKSAMWVGEFTL